MIFFGSKSLSVSIMCHIYQLLSFYNILQQKLQKYHYVYMKSKERVFFFFYNACPISEKKWSTCFPEKSIFKLTKNIPYCKKKKKCPGLATFQEIVYNVIIVFNKLGCCFELGNGRDIN